MTETILAHRYHPRRSLGQGGMGQVWLAEDSVQGGDVALKVLSESLAANEASVLQVKQEFRLMTHLRHPNCCEVYDYGFLEGGKPYFTMEVVPGDGLDGLLPLSPARFRPLLVQLLQALAYVHQRGYVHCDIKSENVRVKPDGTLKLMDFGLMLNAGASGLPIRGTLGYLPPEVIKRGAIDPRSDLYALGCLVFEVLTGELPFKRARPMEVIQAHLNEPPPVRGRLVDDEGRDWAPLLVKLLAKEPVGRFQTAEDVLEALGEAVTGGLGGTLLAAQLVGREAELAALQERLEALERGERGGVFALQGGEGVGKSRLLAELRVRAQLEHLPFGLGTCLRHGSTPLAPVAAAVRSLLPALREAAPALLMEHAPSLVALVPEVGGPAAPELDSPDKEKARLFGALTKLIGGLAAARGLVLAFEDWQAADTLSQEFLAHLLRNTVEARLLLVLSLDAPAAQAAWAEVVTWLPLEGLDRAASARLVGSMLGTDDLPPAFLDKLMGLSGGNPQILEGAVQHLVHTLVLRRAERRWQFTVDWDERLLPVNRLGLMRRRISFLSEDAQALAQVAAVIGQPADLAALLAISRQDEERLFGALEQLLEHQILRREEDGAYVLVHETLIPLLYEGIATPERVRLHGTTLAYLEGRVGEGPVGQAPLEAIAQLARHAFGAADDDRAIRYALEAGKRSTMIYANDEAARLLKAGLERVRAAAEPRAERVDYLRFLADVYRVTGRYDEALPLYHEAITHLEGTGDSLTLGRVLTSLAKLHLVRDQLDEALFEARRALEARSGAGHGPVTLRAMLTEVRALFYLGRNQEAMSRADDALLQARALAHPTLIAQALALRGYLEVAAPEPDVARGVQLLQEASAGFVELGDRLGLYNAANLLGNALMATGDYAEAWQAFEGTRQLAFELGAKDDETFAWLNLALAALELGNPREATQAAARASELATALGSKFTMGMAQAFDAAARAWLGEVTGARDQLAEALSLAQGIKSRYMEMLVYQQQAETLLLLGDAEAALGALGAWKAIKAETGNTEGEARTAALEGEALRALGREVEASAVLEQALEAATRTHAKGDEARVRLGQARLAASAARHDEAGGLARQALAIAEQIGAKLVAAACLGVLGELALAAGRPAGATFEAMEVLAADASAPALLALALFGRAAAAPYEPGAADLVARARARLEAAHRGLDAAGRSCFLAEPARRRVAEGNHIAFSLPSAPRERRVPTGPLGLGMGGL